MSLWQHAAAWGAPPNSAALSLGEGNTPLVRSRRLGAELGLRNLWFKCEGANPTGSYKDRFAAAAVSHLVHDGRKACLGTSSGNTGAAVAAYCARAGIGCFLAIVEGAPEGKLRQMLAYGARLYRIRGFGSVPAMNDAVFAGLRALADELQAGLEISAYTYSPRGMAGVQTISLELAAALPGATLDVFCPAGAGGLTLAVARGFAAVAAGAGGAGGPARVHCVQPAGNDTIATPLRAGRDKAQAVTSQTAISGLQVGSVLDGHEVVAACRRSGGQGHVVTDEQVWAWQARLAKEEGVFCEPAGAVALAGVAEAVRRGELAADATVVCLVTGSGFKDERALVRMAGESPVPLLDGFGPVAEQVRAAVRAGRG